MILEEKVCGGPANGTQSVEDFPSHISINGMKLIEQVLKQVEALSVDVDVSLEVERLDLSRSPKEIETEQSICTGSAIILATGREPVKLDLDTDCDCIHYCSVCDGAAKLFIMS